MCGQSLEDLTSALSKFNFIKEACRMETIICLLMAMYFMQAAESGGFKNIRKFLYVLSILSAGMGVINLIAWG